MNEQGSVTFKWYEYNGLFTGLPKLENAAYSLMDENKVVLSDNKNIGGLFNHDYAVTLLKKGRAKYFLCITF